MKILERIVDGLILQVVSIADSQSSFVPGRGTTDAIFVVQQLQEKCLAMNQQIDLPSLTQKRLLTMSLEEKLFVGEGCKLAVTTSVETA